MSSWLSWAQDQGAAAMEAIQVLYLIATPAGIVPNLPEPLDRRIWDHSSLWSPKTPPQRPRRLTRSRRLVPRTDQCSHAGQ